MISPSTAFSGLSAPSKDIPHCLRTTPTRASATRVHGKECYRTFASVRADEPSVAASLDDLLSANSFLDRSLDMVGKLLQADELCTQLHGDAVLGEVRPQDVLVVVLRHLDWVVLSSTREDQPGRV